MKIYRIYAHQILQFTQGRNWKKDKKKIRSLVGNIVNFNLQKVFSKNVQFVDTFIEFKSILKVYDKTIEQLSSLSLYMLQILHCLNQFSLQQLFSHYVVLCKPLPDQHVQCISEHQKNFFIFLSMFPMNVQIHLFSFNYVSLIFVDLYQLVSTYSYISL